jgi:hypothetical protein
VNQYVNASTMSVDEVLNSGKIAEVNPFFPKSGRKSCQAADISRGPWTAAIVTERLTAAFAPKHRAFDNLCQRFKPAWNLAISHEDEIEASPEFDSWFRDLDMPEFGLKDIDRPQRMTKGNFESSRWRAFDTPAKSDFVQLCKRGSKFGTGANEIINGESVSLGSEFIHDRPWHRTAYRAADKLLRSGTSTRQSAPSSCSMAKRGAA